MIRRLLARLNPPSPQAGEGDHPQDGGGAAPLRSPQAEAEAWRPGDLAECVHDGPWTDAHGHAPPHGHPGPVKGEVRIVAALGTGCRAGETMLGFARYAPRTYSATAFRRIVPRRAVLVAADPLFLAWLRALPLPLDERAP